jgi:hypothetical protein
MPEPVIGTLMLNIRFPLVVPGDTTTTATTGAAAPGE